jgi:hypothetical protein
MLRVCQNCGENFDVEYSGRGKPRAYCYVCLPPGARWVKGRNTSRVSSPRTIEASCR